jgi:hypothetical protein
MTWPRNVPCSAPLAAAAHVPDPLAPLSQFEGRVAQVAPTVKRYTAFSPSVSNPCFRSPITARGRCSGSTSARILSGALPLGLEYRMEWRSSASVSGGDLVQDSLADRVVGNSIHTYIQSPRTPAFARVGRYVGEQSQLGAGWDPRGAEGVPGGAGASGSGSGRAHVRVRNASMPGSASVIRLHGAGVGLSSGVEQLCPGALSRARSRRACTRRRSQGADSPCACVRRPLSGALRQQNGASLCV